jgi:PKD repeat protein
VNDGPWTYRIDWGDGSEIETGTAESQPTIDRTHTYTIAGSRTVDLLVTDKDGGVGHAIAKLEVNAPPTVTSIGGPYTGTEGVSLSFTGSAFDPEVNPITYRWDFGDGTTAASGSRTSSHAYADNGSYVVSLVVTDSKGLQSAATTTTATITNVAPKATFNAPTAANEGNNFTLSLTNAVDAAGDLSTLAYSLDCGDGLGYSAFGPASSRTCATSDNGVLIVRAQVRDKDGGVAGYQHTVSVLNVPPVVTAASVATQVRTSFNLIFRFADAGSLDGPWSYQINWGDGTKSTSPVAVASNSATIAALYSYKRAGTYTVTISVTDKNGGIGTASPQVVVR